MLKWRALSAVPVLPVASEMFRGIDIAARLSWSEMEEFPLGNFLRMAVTMVKNLMECW